MNPSTASSTIDSLTVALKAEKKAWYSDDSWNAAAAVSGPNSLSQSDRLLGAGGTKSNGGDAAPPDSGITRRSL